MTAKAIQRDQEACELISAAWTKGRCEDIPLDVLVAPYVVHLARVPQEPGPHVERTTGTGDPGTDGTPRTLRKVAHTRRSRQG